MFTPLAIFRQVFNPHEVSVRFPPLVSILGFFCPGHPATQTCTALTMFYYLIELFWRHLRIVLFGRVLLKWLGCALY